MKKTLKKTVKTKKGKKPEKGITVLPVVIMLASVVAFGAMGYSVYRQMYPPKDGTRGVACTQEAMLCPDGTTYVGRSGPSCEFAECPLSDGETEDAADSLTTYTNATYGATISYNRDSVVTGSDENGIRLASSQSCADALKLPTTIVASGCVYPSFAISTTPATVSGTKAVTSTVDLDDGQWQKIIDETNPQSSVEIYQMQRDGKWFIVQAQYNAATGDGVDLLVSSMADSLSFETSPF